MAVAGIFLLSKLIVKEMESRWIAEKFLVPGSCDSVCGCLQLVCMVARLDKLYEIKKWSSASQVAKFQLLRAYKYRPIGGNLSFTATAKYFHCFKLVGYYNGKCTNSSADVEKIVKTTMTTEYATDVTVVPALIRMQFHDCFVRGCDASILLESNTSNAEKNADPNLTVRGYDVIDDIKKALENQCGTGIVSCADIIIMAAREAVVLGGGSFYNVTTGRRDGTISNKTEAELLLPPAEISVTDSIAAFGNLGMNVSDMVALIGGHTVGVAHCSSFQDRLYNYNNTGKADPTMDSTLLASLKTTCPQNSTVDNTANLDQNTVSLNTFDNSFFMQIQKNKGILGIDQEIDLDTRTNGTVSSFASNNSVFLAQFATAFVKMGATNVILEPAGEIRLNCRSTN
ncbi:peroxidase 28-like [Macadamia integrifolia]|uniref:peroxidase 28-like n=1 Tax=Macadamia integrifolia TaxID=60698 RepID=UPI001C52B46C|nr:peroxidase 28-like [Macadamia integrifolia]